MFYLNFLAPINTVIQSDAKSGLIGLVDWFFFCFNGFLLLIQWQDNSFFRNHCFVVQNYYIYNWVCAVDNVMKKWKKQKQMYIKILLSKLIIIIFFRAKPAFPYDPGEHGDPVHAEEPAERHHNRSEARARPRHQFLCLDSYSFETLTVVVQVVSNKSLCRYASVQHSLIT